MLSPMMENDDDDEVQQMPMWNVTTTVVTAKYIIWYWRLDTTTWESSEFVCVLVSNKKNQKRLVGSDVTLQILGMEILISSVFFFVRPFLTSHHKVFWVGQLEGGYRTHRDDGIGDRCQRKKFIPTSNFQHRKKNLFYSQNIIINVASGMLILR